MNEIISPTTRVVVIGQGYVGLPASLAAVIAGHSVVGFDIDADKTSRLAGGHSPIEDVTDDDVRAMLATGRYTPTCRADALEGFHVALVTVPTPLYEGRPDLTAVLRAARTLAAYVSHGSVVVLESTVAPGTTAGEFLDALEQNVHGLAVQRNDFYVGFSPERIDPGNEMWHFTNTPKLVSGVTFESAERIQAFYSTICDVVIPCPSTATAEMAKLLENTYRHVNIALVNELGRHANELGVSIWDVINAAKTKPYGYQAFYPGPGVGGHCLPVDPIYLSDRVERNLGRSFDFVDLAVKVNEAQPAYITERVVKLLNKQQRAVNGSRILVLGMAYKANTGDVRETPATAIVEMLRDLGAAVWICDPHVPDLTGFCAARYPDVKVVPRDELQHALRTAHLTVLVTDHDSFSYREIADNVTLLLDTRNRVSSKRVGIHSL